MAVVVNQERYVPVGVLPFSMIKPDAPADAPQAPDLFNAELQAIRDAFNGLWALPVVTGDVVLTASSRNALVDLSGLADTNTGLVVTLPESPNIGDPPCIVIVKESGYHTAPGNFEACAVVTSLDANIRGFAQENSFFSSQMPLFNPGDVAICIFLGGTWGWDIQFVRSAVVNPIGFTFPAIGSFPCPGVEIVNNHTGSTGYGPDTPAWNLGDRFSITQHDHVVTFGDDTYTFNGIVGPYTISTNDLRVEFTSLGGLDFTVTS